MKGQKLKSKSLRSYALQKYKCIKFQPLFQKKYTQTFFKCDTINMISISGTFQKHFKSAI